MYGVLVETLLDKTNDHKWFSREERHKKGEHQLSCKY